MTVYVDDMRRLATVRGLTRRWSHLIADDPRELRDFANSIGLSSAWVQARGTANEHFDVTDGVRARALALGAVPISYFALHHVVAEISQKFASQHAQST